MRGINLRGALAAVLILLSTAGAQEAKPKPPALAAADQFFGQLVDQDGKPLAGIKMCLSTRELLIFEMGLPDEDVAHPESDVHFATTDVGGRFSFPSQGGNYDVLAFTDVGYVIAKAKNLKWPATIKLTPWAKLEGTVMIGDKTAPSTIRVDAFNAEPDFDDELGPYPLYQTQTDEKGHFKFDRVIAGNYSVSRSFGRTSGKPVKINVPPGKTTEVIVPYSGQTVKGRTVLPPEFAKATWHRETLIENSANLPVVTLPTGILTMSSGQRLDWSKQWLATTEGKGVLAEQQQLRDLDRSPVEISTDGSFQIEDLSPGTYRMASRFYLITENGKYIDYEHKASVVYQFAVNPIPGSVSGVPVDVGLLSPQAAGTKNAGQMAPDIVFSTVDGQSIQLSQFRGKVILLDFWGTWCGQCLHQIPDLQAIHDEYKSNPNFVMISLSVDDEPATLQKFLAEHEMPWTHGILGLRAVAWQTDLYEVPGYPSYWAIGPDGKVLGNTWLFDELKPILEKAIASAK